MSQSAGETRSVGDNETFVRLMRVAQEDPEIRRQLLSILSQPPERRHTTIRTYVAHLSSRSAPGDFVEAISSLMNDQVAEAALELLRHAASG